MKKLLIVIFLFQGMCVFAQDSGLHDQVAITQKSSKKQGLFEKVIDSKLVLIGFSLILGGGLGFLLGRTKNPLSKISEGDQTQKSVSNTSHSYQSEISNLETQNNTLRHQLRKKDDEIKELKRQQGEDQYRSEKGNKQANIIKRSDSSQLAHPQTQQAVQNLSTLYFLQPTIDGKFKESSRVQERENAIYELSFDKRNGREAKLRFIASNAITSFAIQNEPTWILVACERKNLPSEATKTIHTEEPGAAPYLSSGEWEITQKAKITYV